MILNMRFSDDCPKEFQNAPQYATEGSACFDLVAITDTVVMPESVATVRTGLHIEIPEGYCLKIYSRSGHGAYGIRLSNCVGVIDSDYRGEILVKMISDTYIQKKINRGDRIAQAALEKVTQVYFKVVEDLSDTERGSGGFGSTDG